MQFLHMPTIYLISLILILSEISEAVHKQLHCKNGNKLLGMKTMTEEDKKRILKLHNVYRNHIASGSQQGQPPAENMLELTWDSYAAIQAYMWASGCKFEHNNPKSLDKSPMGQNLYIRMYSRKQDVNTTFNRWVDGMIDGWYNEVKLYNFGDSFSMDTGHYTQLIWAKTGKVGCGYSYFLDTDKWYTGYLVCNYSPAGNYVGQKPYIVGKRNCKKHNLENSKNYQHLCISKD